MPIRNLYSAKISRLPVGLGNDLLSSDPLVDRPGVLLVDHKLVEDVDSVLLALLEVVVYYQAT